MAAVTVETPSGERVTISTAHTDYNGVSAEEQADQIDELREHTEEVATEVGSDYTIVTGDLNHTIDENSPAGESLRQFEEEGYANAGAGVPAEYPEEEDGSTSSYGHGNPIDYVFTGPGLAYGDVDRVQGDQPEIEGEDNNMSDHDGIAVTVDVPQSGVGVGSGTGGGSGGSW
jgi:endonuclease/exonuclease/phosphatase family metal-dependent hydrolase